METVYQKTYARVGQKAIITSGDGKILVLKRSGLDNEDKWSLPGGAIEKDEDPIKSIGREIKEETNLDVSLVTPFTLRSYCNKDNDFVVIIGYQCYSNSEEVILNEEHTEFRWLTPKEALASDLSSDGRFFLEKFVGIKS